MASKPLTTEAIALTEKKMDMTLDDIIKMSKKNTTKEKRPPRFQIKHPGFLNGSASQRNTRVQRVMDFKSSIRQGVLTQKRSIFRGNQLPLATSIARKAAVMPIRNMAVNRSRPSVAPARIQRKAADRDFAGKETMTFTAKQRPQTLDALFANMKEKRMKVMFSQQRDNNRHSRRVRQQQQQRRGDIAPPRRWGGNYSL